MDAAELGRDVNVAIRDAVASLSGNRSDSLFVFTCECGCFELVRMTVAAFDAAGGAWLDGHGAPLVAEA